MKQVPLIANQLPRFLGLSGRFLIYRGTKNSFAHVMILSVEFVYDVHHSVGI